ncbi:MAG TPA: glycosyltransferase [Candidatus Paceibacterota bacterium]|nr:glycosyltransferase [Candidatus Paceibacterota bacterium]
MKIFYSITKSEIGGAQTYLWSLLKRAKENNDEVVVMSYPGGWLEDKVKELGFEFIPNIYYKNSYNPFNLLKAIFLTRKEIKKFNPDMLHLNSGGAGFFGRLANVGLRSKVVFTAHGWSFTDGTPLFRRIIALIAENLITPFTDKIICVSENDARLAKNKLIFSTSKIEVIHNGVEIKTQTANQENINKIKILFVGRLERPKMPVVILRSLMRLTDEERKFFNVSIIGFGSQEKLLLDFINKNDLINLVTIRKVNFEAVYEECLSSNLFILPTEWEGFPMTIIGAMSAGLPVLASNVGGIKEVVDSSVGKLLSKGNDELEIVQVLRNILLDKKWLSVCGQNARKRILDNFSEEEMCNKVWKIYEQV